MANGFLRHNRWLRLGLVLAVIVFAMLLPLWFGPHSIPLPGTGVSSDPIPVEPDGVRLLVDQTIWDEGADQQEISQDILDALLDRISQADAFIVADFFLWNEWTGQLKGEVYRKMAVPLAEALIAQKKKLPDMPVLVISDPINHVYGGPELEHFVEMREAGIEVVYTDLDKMPDSNWIYGRLARFYRRLLPSLSDPDGWAHRGRLRHPFQEGGEKISLAQAGNLLFFKANHRKVLITGSESSGLDLVVSSLNPADGGSAHTNVGLWLKGEIAMEALESELAVAGWSTRCLDAYAKTADRIRMRASGLVRHVEDSGIRVRWLTEGGIHRMLLDVIGSCGDGDQLDLALFYVSERALVRALKSAVKRGARVRVLLDANRDAFGRVKTGIPNRLVAKEMQGWRGPHRVEVRWADTHGEQFHCKAMAVKRKDADPILLLGSANWTRRNLRDLNLEANAMIEGSGEAITRFEAFFDEHWVSGSLPYSAWEEKGATGFFKGVKYRFLEWSGMGTF